MTSRECIDPFPVKPADGLDDTTEKQEGDNEGVLKGVLGSGEQQASLITPEAAPMTLPY